MVWTAPQTWVTDQVVTAADMNGDVRDNMLETAAATAAAAGDIVYADGANSMGSRLAHPGTGRILVSDASNGLAWRQDAEDVDYANAATSSTFTETNYTADADQTAGGSGDTLPSVTVTTGTRAIVIVSAQHVRNDSLGANVLIAYSVSGATTQSASDAHSAQFESDPANQISGQVVPRLQILTAGSNTFQVEARVTAGTGTINRPRILVIPR